MKRAVRPRRPQGFLLLEVILAIGIFGMAAVGFAVAINRTADAASMAQRRMMITRILDSALTEALSLPVLEEGVTTVTLDETLGGTAIEVDTLIEPLEEMMNQDGEILQQMYRIEVSAHWYEAGEWMEESAETWRYGRMYQP